MTGKHSAATLKNLYEQRRSPGSFKNAATADWSDERIERLRALWAEGLSCSQIAAELGGGATRNSVIGKANRLKLPPRLSKSPFANKASRVPGIARNRSKLMKRTRQANTPGRLPLLPKVEAPAFVYVEPPPPSEAPEALRLNLIELSDKTCRWPIGDPRHADFHFCGHEPRGGSRYCDFHYRRSIGAGTIGEQVAIGVAIKASRMESA